MFPNNKPAYRAALKPPIQPASPTHVPKPDRAVSLLINYIDIDGGKTLEAITALFPDMNANNLTETVNYLDIDDGRTIETYSILIT